jgi:signal peptidase I
VRDFMKGTLKFLVAVLVLLGIAAAVLRIFFVDQFVVPHNGMAPTLEAGDEVFVWRDATPDLGDVAVCTNPRNAADKVIGRVIAIGPATVRGARGALEIDRRVVDVDWTENERFTDTLTRHIDQMRRGTADFVGGHEVYERTGATFTLNPTEVANGRAFLLSDNRTYAGRDSRAFGTVDPASCSGVVFMRFRPPPETPNTISGWLTIIE